MLPKLALLASLALCLGNAPVAPLAEGTLDGILSAAKAARQCGLKQMRIQIYEEITMIFDEGGPSYGEPKPIYHASPNGREGTRITWLFRGLVRQHMTANSARRATANLSIPDVPLPRSPHLAVTGV